jgi:quinol monooxygenase YgiN
MRQTLMLGLGLGLMAAAPISAMAVTCDPAEVGYIASFKVTPGHEAAFESGIANLAAVVNAEEPGVVLYAPYRDADGEYWMMERYTDLQAREVHATSDAVLTAFEPMAPLLAEPPVVRAVSAICP